MANKVTGSTDTTGALSVAPKMQKSALLIGQKSGTTTATVNPNTVFSITGTADAGEKFGGESIMVKAVKALIQNGIDTFYGVIVDSTVGEGGAIATNYGNALQASLGEKSCQFVVLDNYDNAVITELKTHLAMAESEDLFRYAVVAGTSSDNDALVEQSEAIGDSRIFVAGPEFTNDGTTSTNATIVVAGVTGAIMVELSGDPALPMNGVAVNGIGSVKKSMLESEKKLLGENGVTVLYNDGTPKIHRLVTSSSDEIWKEGTTRFIADYVLENVENTLRANYQRTKNVVRILDSIKTTVKGLLENFEGLEIIENFDPATLTVVKDPTDVYGALVDYEFDVVTPLYTITIKQHMKL